jgi:phosphoglycerol transferase
VFIAFFSLLAVAIGIEWFYERRVKTGSARIVFYVVVGVMCVAALLDQTSRGYIPQYAQVKSEFESDRNFVAGIAARLPQGASIFQLPYIPFPEHPGVEKMVDYDHLRGYLQSQNLRWSYGAIKNRAGDLWLKQIAALPVEEMCQSLAFAGFSGVYIDRNGYDDDSFAALESQLRDVLQTEPIASENRRLVFYNSTDYISRLRQKYSESDWQAKQDLTLHPLMMDWKGGFSGLETSPEKNWRWCSHEGELHLYNTSQRARQVNVEMSFVSGYEEFADLVISGLISDQLKTNANPVAYSKTITVPPGESIIKFTSNGRRVDAPLDPRVLIFRIENFKMTIVE